MRAYEELVMARGSVACYAKVFIEHIDKYGEVSEFFMSRLRERLAEMEAAQAKWDSEYTAEIKKIEEAA